MIKKLLFEERGSAMIIFTIGLTVFFGFLSFVADTGLLYYNKASLANGVDAAALAGAQELPYKPISAVEKATSYASVNGVDISTNKFKIVINETKTKIKVSAEKSVNLLFRQVFGIDSGFVNHTATAQVAPISSVGGAAPLGIKKHDFIFGDQYTLKVGANDTDFLLEDGVSPGWFGALSLGASGSNNYEANLKNGYPGSVKVGDIIPIETGNMSNPTKRSIDFRVAEDKHTPYCTVDSFERDCTRLLIVPVIELFDKHNVKIVGFAIFLVDESVTGQGNENFVKGKFVKTLVSGDSDPNGQDFGLKGIKLIE